ncbi:hypothetical protein BDV34DRAFT_188696 [Aspergillus parasiticus]|uniref:Uncharacterized protein n=1 Tax=Aspergillus parasiticus TaxID=5067 RepID=A0A5N6DX13_ASPPA|nr:hypothetical protein BDV34DRAFT_188696 [Aspergillus parasiticus]
MLRSGVAAGLRLLFIIPTFIFCADRSHGRFHFLTYLQNAEALSFIMRINNVFPYRFMCISLQLIYPVPTAALLLLGKVLFLLLDPLYK